MTRGLHAWRVGRLAWLLVASLLVLPAGLLGVADPLSWSVLGWQPELAWQQPWRCWSAAWLHLSALHLGANLAGALLVLALGWLLDPPRAAAWAWALAWPLTQLGLLLQPGLLRYGGLSGVLHAGVAICAVGLLLGRRRPVARPAEPSLGAALIAGLLLKVLLERPWAGPLREMPGWDIALAPLAHASGLFWGLLLGALVFARRPGRPA